MARAAQFQSRHSCSRLVSLVAAAGLLIGSTSPTRAQQSGGATQPQTHGGAPPPRARCTNPPERGPAVTRDNGVVVGQTKLFDERSLRVKLESAEEGLRRITAIDTARVAQATGTLQGARERQRSIGVSATTLPGVILGSDNNPPESNPDSPTQPTVPTAPGQTSLIPFQPATSISAQDLLAEQMSLAYQVINLRLLLERSLTDRVYIKNYDDGGFSPATRAQAIAGFQISVDPRTEYKNSVAEVEVTITSDCAKHDAPPSLVSLLPRDKTYNVATVSKDSKSFGLGAVVQVLNVGVNANGSSEALYLVRDTDTVALERLRPHDEDSAAPPNPNSLTFGWQFRPVLGRKAVESGTRQVYAQLALPIRDDFGAPFDGIVEVRTHWRHYDAKTNTVGAIISGSESYRRLDDLVVRAGGFDEHVLGPQVSNVKWSDAGGGQVLVTVRGANFLNGTSVLVGDTLIDGPDKGLSLQGENFMLFRAPAEKLALFGAPLIVGRYGPAVKIQNVLPFEFDRAGRDMRIPLGIKIPVPPETRVVDAQNSSVKLVVEETRYLQGENYDTDIPQYVYQPVVVIGNKVFGPGANALNSKIITDVPYDADHFREAPRRPLSDGLERVTYELTLTAPTSLLRDARALTVKELLYSERFTAVAQITLGDDDFTATELIPLMVNSGGARYAIRGSGFGTPVPHASYTPPVVAPLQRGTRRTRPANARVQSADIRAEAHADNGLRVYVGSKTFCAEGCDGRLEVLDPTLIRIDATAADFKGVKNIIVTRGSAQAATLSLPKPPDVPKPVVEKVDEISEGSSKTIKFKGSSFDSVEAVKFEGQELEVVDVAPDGSWMTVAVTSVVTAKAGDKELHFHLKNGSVVPYVITVKKP